MLRLACPANSDHIGVRAVDQVIGSSSRYHRCADTAMDAADPAPGGPRARASLTK